jgi:hypothetical protein
MSKTPQPAPGDQKTTAQAPVPAPNPAYTLPARRLAGSAACRNCGTVLQGPFCHHCGQPDRNFMRFFPVLMREFLEEFMDLDSRFMRTMKPLMFKPGRLTRDYLEGRRFRYTPPLRLYLFASIAFFLLAATLSANAVRIGVNADGASGEPNISISSGAGQHPLTPAQQEQIEQTLAEAGIEDPKGFMEGYTAGWEKGQDSDEGADTFTADQIQIGGEPWNRETNPLVIPFMPEFVNEWVNDEIEESPKKAKRINENPNLIIDQIFDILPGTMFVLLPVVALLFKFWYLFARRFYIEHLIYALHTHAFLFVSLILILLLAQIRGSGWAGQDEWVENAATWMIILVSVWIPLYMLISLRHVYQQGWLLTLGKFFAIGLSYISLLTFVSSVVAVLGFLLL